MQFPLCDYESCPISRLRLISMIHRDCHNFIKSRLGDMGISSGQFPMMFMLCENEGINQGTVAAAMGLDKGTVARSMTRLEEAGLVKRERDSLDRRNYRLSLTDEGKGAMERLGRIRAELESTIICGLSDEELREMERLLQKMHDNVSVGLRDE